MAPTTAVPWLGCASTMTSAYDSVESGSTSLASTATETVPPSATVSASAIAAGASLTGVTVMDTVMVFESRALSLTR